jgi:glycerol-3-phosphate acyltransferase PlsY
MFRVKSICPGMACVAVATLLAGDNPWAATVAGVMAVVGHNWSIFIRFGGGIGLSSLTGAMLYLSPWRTLGAMVGVVLFWLILVRLLRVHRARSTILAMATVGPLLWALGTPPPDILLGALGGVVVIIKTIPDWNRKYE